MAAESALKLDSSHSETHYYYSKALAAWAQFHSYEEWLKTPSEIQNHLSSSRLRPTFSGEKGECFDGFGPLRLLGLLTSRWEYTAGNNLCVSYLALRKAVRQAPYVVANHFFYASTLRCIERRDDFGLTPKNIVEGLIGTAKSPEEAAERFIEKFKGKTFEKEAVDRRAETVFEFYSDLQAVAGQLGISVPWQN